MHIYIFDEFLSANKYQKVVAAIETRITDLGLQGKNRHVGTLKSLASIVSDELRTTPTTIVAVGNDKTFSQVLNTVKHAPVALGYIPIGTKQVDLARFLGIENEEQACTTLSARLIEQLTPALCNRTGLFLHHATIPTKETLMEIDGNYTLNLMPGGVVTFYPHNQRSHNTLDVHIDIEPRSLFRSGEVSKSRISAKTVILNNTNDAPITLDGAITEKTPAEISMAPFSVQLVVGKKRQFNTTYQ